MDKKDSGRFLSFGERENSNENEESNNSDKELDFADKEKLADGLESKEEKEQMESLFPEEAEAGQTPTPINLDTGRFANKKNSSNNVVKIPRSHRKQISIAILVIIVLIAAFAIFWHFRSFKSYEVVTSTDRFDETAMEYLQFQGGFVKYNVDGITYEDKTGTIIWTEAFNMTMPKVVICGEYVAITDIGNNEYTLYNSTKKVQTVTTDFPISDIQVAKQGLVAVILEDEKVDYITAFDISGAKVLEIKTTISKNGYPMAIAMSEDGTKLVAAYVVVDSSEVTSNLTFYNFGNVGKNEVDRQVGNTRFEGELFPRIAFADNNTVVAYSDKRMILYSMKEKPKEVLNEKLNSSVKSIFYNSKFVGYIANADKQMASSNSVKHEEKAADEDEDRYVINGYTLSGASVLSKEISYYYTNMHANEKEIILIGKKSCEVYTTSGNLKFKGKFDGGISDLFPTTNTNEFILMTPSKTETIRLK
ncbi:MAG: DUF5711 family protein [Lachnospiraceae bacterium]|nr:DUF5711 family protein [Lachnospiraceae bacterium]